MSYNYSFRTILILLFFLLMWEQSCEAASRKKTVTYPTTTVEATVLSLRRYEHGTYVEVLPDYGQQEWIEISREYGFMVKQDQRIAYTVRSPAHEDKHFGRLRTAYDFRILPQLRDDHVYQGSAPDGSLVYTDNPSTAITIMKTPTVDSSKENRKSQQSKLPIETNSDEMLVVDQDDLLREKELTEDYYRYLDRTNVEKPIRKAKRAKARQPQ